MRLLVVLTMSIGVLTSGEAFAGLISFTDRTAFLNAAANAGLTTTNEDFVSNPGDPFTIDDLNGNSVTFDVLDGFYAGTTESISGSIAPARDVELSSTSVTGSVVGIGFDSRYIFGAGFSSLQRLELNGGDAVISTFANSGNTTSFLGLLSTDGMSIASVDDITLQYEPTNHFPQLDNLVIVTGSVEAVPEPSTLALLGMGGLGMAAYQWRRKRKPLA